MIMMMLIINHLLDRHYMPGLALDSLQKPSNSVLLETF